MPPRPGLPVIVATKRALWKLSRLPTHDYGTENQRQSLRRPPGTTYGCVVRLEADGGCIFGAACEFLDPVCLQERLSKTTPEDDVGSFYILEGMGPGFIGVLGSHLSAFVAMR